MSTNSNIIPLRNRRSIPAVQKPTVGYKHGWIYKQGGSVRQPRSFMNPSEADIEAARSRIALESAKSRLALEDVMSGAIKTHSDGNAMTDLSREEIDAKIAASEARTDTKITRFEGKLDLVLSKLEDVKATNETIRTDVREDGRSTRANLWTIAFGLAILIVTLAALYPSFFGIGAQVKDMVDSAVQSHLQALQKPAK